MTINKNTELEFSLQQDAERGGVYTNFYTEDKGSASIRIRLTSYGQSLDLTKTDLKPVLFLFHADGSIFEIKDFINVMPEQGLIQYNISDNVIRHAGKIKAKVFLKNDNKSIHVANFTFDIRDSGIDGAIGKEIKVELLEDIVRNVMSDNAMGLLDDEYKEKINQDVVDYVASNPDNYKGPKGDTGEQGTQGEKGPIGPKGEPGDTEKLVTRNVVSSGENKPLITFVDDDGRTEVIAKWEPILQEKGNKLTIPLITQWMDDPNNTSVITWEDVHRLKEQYGVEFVSHTHEHKHAQQLTAEEVDKEFKESKKILKREGLTHNIIVQPYGENTQDVRRLSRNYFKANIGTKEGTNTAPFDTFNAFRISLGENLYTTFEQYKAKIDEAIANNGWIIFKSHSQYTTFDDNQLQLIRQIIDYARQNNMLEVSLEEGLDLFGNLIDSGDYTARAQGIDYYVMDRDGKVYSNFGDKNYYTLRYNTVSISTPITDFKEKTTSTVAIVSTNSQGFPNNTSGQLVTTKSESLGLSYQLYMVNNSNDIYKRRWNTKTNNWTEFEKITGSGGSTSKLTISSKQTVNLQVPANSYADANFPIEGVKNDDNVIVTPRAGIEVGLMYNGFINTDGSVRIRFWNMTSSPVTTNRPYKIDIIKNT